MTGQCKHCSHFCTGRIGSVVSLEWSQKLQGCYLGVCWWTHIGIFPWPHPATTGIVLLNSERTQKPEQPAVVAVFWCLAWLGCSVLPSLSTSTARWLFCSSRAKASQVLPETMPNKRRPFRGFSGPGKHAWHWHWLFHFGFGVSEEDHIFWHYPSYIWVKKRGPHPTIQMDYKWLISGELHMHFYWCIDVASYFTFLFSPSKKHQGHATFWQQSMAPHAGL